MARRKHVDGPEPGSEPWSSMRCVAAGSQPAWLDYRLDWHLTCLFDRMTVDFLRRLSRSHRSIQIRPRVTPLSNGVHHRQCEICATSRERFHANKVVSAQTQPHTCCTLSSQLIGLSGESSKEHLDLCSPLRSAPLPLRRHFLTEILGSIGPWIDSTTVLIFTDQVPVSIAIEDSHTSCEILVIHS